MRSTITTEYRRSLREGMPDRQSEGDVDGLKCAGVGLYASWQLNPNNAREFWVRINIISSANPSHHPTLYNLTFPSGEFAHDSTVLYASRLAVSNGPQRHLLQSACELLPL